MIELYVRIGDDEDPVLVGTAGCSRAVPNLLNALAEKWSNELLLADLDAQLDGNYKGVITGG